MRIFEIARRRAPLALAVLVTGCGIAACGSSSSSSSTTSSSAAASSSGSTTARRAALIACLRSHGVNLPSRPGGFRGRPPSGGAGTGAGGPRFFGGGAPNPKLQAAFKACGANFGRRGRFPRISHPAIQKYVACVRQHGYNLPNPNLSGHGPVFPASIRSNPKFQSASRPCQRLLFPARTGSPSPRA